MFLLSTFKYFFSFSKHLQYKEPRVLIHNAYVNQFVTDSSPIKAQWQVLLPVVYLVLFFAILWQNNLLIQGKIELRSHHNMIAQYDAA